MRVIATDLPGVLAFEPELHSDSRGTFMEAYNAARYAAAGVTVAFVQDNVSRSRRDVLRGLHFQHPKGQAKLVGVLDGEVFDVVVDVRPDSPAFGRWTGMVLSADNRRQVLVPAGFAHGFCVTSEHCLVAYKCSAFYAPEAEQTLAWNDPDLSIEWPVTAPILSAKDAAGRRLRAFAPEQLPSIAAARPRGGG